MIHYDTISRTSMLQGLRTTPEANRCLPFVRMWYTREPEHIWHDSAGHPRSITQAEGGEQGNPLMPALFSLGQYKQCKHSSSLEKPCTPFWMTYTRSCSQTESVLYMICWPTTWKHMPTSASTRAKLVFGTVAATNQPTPKALGPRHGQATGNSLPPNKVSPCWGPPIGTEQYVQITNLCSTNCRRSRISKQHGCCYCTLPALAAITCSDCSRLHRPGFAADHDLEVTRCLTQPLQTNQLPVDAAARAHLPLAMGGLVRTDECIPPRSASFLGILGRRRPCLAPSNASRCNCHP